MLTELAKLDMQLTVQLADSRCCPAPCQHPTLGMITSFSQGSKLFCCSKNTNTRFFDLPVEAESANRAATCTAAHITSQCSIKLFLSCYFRVN